MNTEKQIEAAAKRCRAAFAKYPEAKFAWCCHHEEFCEPLTEPAENRIQFILKNKASSERVKRLNNFRPVRDYKKFQPALAEYEKVRQTTLAEYEKVCQTAWAEYEKVCQTAWAEYEKVRQTALAEYEKVCQPALAEYEKVCQPALAEYEKVCQTALAEYEKVCQTAWAEYEKVCQTAAKPLKKLYKQDVPSGTWNGRSIFNH
jgi:Fe-S cluster biosynthesis and repair protein YggX